MIERVYQYITEHKMTQAGNRILVGVSGGADSTCLLCVLKDLAPRLDVSLEVLHVHHMIRGAEADRDAAFVEELCREWSLPFHLERVDVPTLAAARHVSMETAAREARYEALEMWRERLNADAIAVAHHQGDQAETVLLHLLRGSGLEGLSGMMPVRERIIRPLLCVCREEIEAFLTARQQKNCLDGTNAENVAARNKLRNQVLPYLKAEVNAGAEENILRAARMIRSAHEYLRKQAAAALASAVRYEAGDVCIDAETGRQQEPIILSYMIRLAVEECKGDVLDVEECHVQSIASLFWETRERHFDLPGRLWACRKGAEVILSTRCPEKEDVVASLPLLPLKMRTFSYDSSKKIPENRYTKWFDYDKIKDCVAVRHRQEGDYLTIAPAGTKSLRRFFIDHKIPKGERDACTLVADGSHILWVVGYRISEAYKVTEKTRTILEISIEETKDEREN